VQIIDELQEFKGFVFSTLMLTVDKIPYIVQEECGERYMLCSECVLYDKEYTQE